MHVGGRQSKKDLNFELNLIPIMDILSVCICFLLLTAVWVQVGAMQVNQALDGTAQGQTKNPPAIWATFRADGGVDLVLKNGRGSLSSTVVNQSGRLAWKQLVDFTKQARRRNPELQTAIVVPQRNTSYSDLMNLMDELKTSNIRDIGLSPI
ncbi:MAG: biopolymer transporter ExbD [Oligoflexia bacterium]|nr:biopolymer transporter ExbD [Oligoflexia bacterium]